MGKEIPNEIAELLVRGIISTLPEEDQKKAMECFDKIMAIWVEYGEDIGTIAFTLASSKILKEKE